MNTVTITRRSKVGFGYTSAVENDERGNLAVCNVTQPDFTGTILTVGKEISHNRTLASYRSGGTYYRTAWFVKINGQWRKIVRNDENYFELNKLTLENDYDRRERTGQKYYADAVVVEIE